MFFKSVNYSWYFLPVTGIVITIILIFKVFLDSYHGSNISYQYFPHVNVFADTYFYDTDTNREITQRYSFAWLYKKYNRDDFDIMQYKNLVMKKFYLSALILVFTSFITMSLFVRINKMLVLNKANVVIIYDGVNDKGEPISIHRNYYKTGFLTYDMNKTTLLMTTEAVDKRRKEEYDRTHKE
jgi:hypothetical protein